jgi:hypothetical protein
VVDQCRLERNDRATSLAALRRELERFLLDAGEPVHHPDDTTRMDFTADFRPIPLLDDQQLGRTNG